MDKIDNTGKPLLVTSKQRLNVASSPTTSIDLREKDVKLISSFIKKYHEVSRFHIAMFLKSIKFVHLLIIWFNLSIIVNKIISILLNTRCYLMYILITINRKFIH